MRMSAVLELFGGRNSVAMVPFVTVFLSAEDALLQVQVAISRCESAVPGHAATSIFVDLASFAF